MQSEAKRPQSQCSKVHFQLQLGICMLQKSVPSFVPKNWSRSSSVSAIVIIGQIRHRKRG